MAWFCSWLCTVLLLRFRGGLCVFSFFLQVVGLVRVSWCVPGVACLCCFQLYVVVLCLCVRVVFCQGTRVETVLGLPKPFGGSLFCFLVPFVCACFAVFVF